MISIKLDKPNKLHSNILVKTSAFVSFDYDVRIVEYIKNMSTRVYIPETHTWEMPAINIIGLCNHFEDMEIEITGTYKDESTSINIEIPGTYKFKTNPFNHQLDGVRFGLKMNKFLLCDDQGLGKALSLNTKIYTTDGYKEMKYINVGDKVFNEDGIPVEVTNTYFHKNVEMYRITFSDKKYIECCKDHLWKIYDQGKERIVDTNWFMQLNHNGVKRCEALRNKTNFNYYIPKCNPVNFNHREIKLNPYILGALLGDGSFRTGSISFTTKDSFIKDKINSLLPEGYKLNSSKSMQNISYNIIGTNCNRKNKNIVKQIITELDLYNKNSHNKFIPDSYKYNDVDVRFQLLQGLIDTDGYVTKQNLVQYTTVSEKLCDDVEFLVESIGGLCTKTISQCGYDNKITGMAYTLTIKLDDPTVICSLPRKKNLLSARKFTPHRNIIKIEKIENADAKCITVSGKSSLYLAEHFIVTHNTKQIIDLAGCLAEQDKSFKRVLIICGVNSLKYNWANEIATHSNEKSWVLGTRIRKNGNTYEGTSKDKMYDLNNLPNCKYIITNIESMRIGAEKVSKTKYVFEFADKIKSLCDAGEISMIALDECHKCFDYDTLVKTDLGELKIGDIVENQINCNVLSYNEITKTFEYKPIVNFWKNNTSNSKFIKLTFEDYNGFEKTIKCTDDHLFLTKNRGWVIAKDLTEYDDFDL